MLSADKQVGAQSQIKSYRTPEVKALEFKARSVICTSTGGGNDSLSEQDFGDGGFVQP
ncbi:MAG: hypothetical protein KBS38_00785 [Bacteroidales bacterium]|nr:hypothetical protein [Candidatus Cacconaster caballi]